MTSPRHAELIAIALGAALWSAGAAAQAQATSDVRPAPALPPTSAATAGTRIPREGSDSAHPTLPPAPAATASTAQRAPPTAAASAAPAATAPPASAASTSRGTAREAARAALSAPKPGQLRPTGRVSVTADRAELVEGNYAVYTGHVVLTSNTLEMDGARLELRQQANGQFVATLTGTPAHMAHPSSGPDDPPVTAHANTLIFDSAAQLITLSGDAELTRGQNLVTGRTVSYNTENHRVQATGGAGSQVRMVIQPPPPTNPVHADTP